MRRKFILSISVILLVIILDQSLKIWVKTNMLIGESSFYHWNWPIKWFQLYFIENEGMAFGYKLNLPYGKLLLTFLRIILATTLIFLIKYLVQKNYPTKFILCFSLILAGAIGNLIDSIFYGVIFSNSPTIYSLYAEPAKFVEIGKGYAPLFYGKVVDMLYFPLFKINFPQSLPILGGKTFSFFEPIFNIADSSITIGAILLIFFYKSTSNPKK